MNIAIFASGNGSNLQAIVDAVDGGGVKARVALVVSDKGGAYALARARKAGIETVVLNKKDFILREDFDKAAVRELKKHDIGLVVLAGYMRILTPYFINAYSGKILNIHPSLLPLFKGTDGIGDALKAGVSETGVTVHFVTEELDAGPIILQQKVPVSADETKEALAKKIHALEHKLYPEAIRYFIEGRLKVDGDKVVISEK